MTSVRSGPPERGQSDERPVIVVDAGKVLVDFDVGRGFAALSERAGRAISPPLSPRLRDIFTRAEVEARGWETIPAALNEELGIDLDLATWRAVWCRIFTGEIPGMRDALADLGRDFRIVALSNTSRVHWEHVLATYPVFGLLDGWVVSYDEGAAKPAPAIYRAVMERYTGGRRPFFYTDDMPAFVEGARKLGWVAEVFRGAAAFREDVARLRDGDRG